MMRVMRVTLVEPAGEDRAAIAGFIAARNRDGAQHIGYLGEEVDDIAGTLADLEADAVFALAHDDGELVGVLGADWDPAVERAWLYGPYGQGVDDLYAAVAARIPPDLVQETTRSTGWPGTSTGGCSREWWTLPGPPGSS
jgi:hypothetical protein